MTGEQRSHPAVPSKVPSAPGPPELEWLGHLLLVTSVHVALPTG